MSDGDALSIEEEFLAFYFRLGHALASWANAESNLSHIVMDRFSESDQDLALEGYRSIENFRARLQYADELVGRATLTDPALAARWIEIRDRCERLASKRNKLAHWPSAQAATRKAGKRVILYELRRERKPNGRQVFHGALGIKDIYAIELEFLALQMSLWRLREQLNGVTPEIPESFEKAARPHSLSDLRRELYRYAKSPPKRPKRPKRA